MFKIYFLEMLFLRLLCVFVTNLTAGGNPEIIIGPTSRIKHHDGLGEPAYPWTKHLHKNDPANAVVQWIAASTAAAAG